MVSQNCWTICATTAGTILRLRHCSWRNPTSGGSMPDQSRRVYPHRPMPFPRFWPQQEQAPENQSVFTPMPDVKPLVLPVNQSGIRSSSRPRKPTCDSIGRNIGPPNWNQQKMRPTVDRTASHARQSDAASPHSTVPLQGTAAGVQTTTSSIISVGES